MPDARREKIVKINYTKKAISTIVKMQDIVAQRMSCSVEKWLDIACKLDYITLTEKQQSISLIKKWQPCQICKGKPKFCKNQYFTLKRMKQIISNTVFPPELIRSALK